MNQVENVTLDDTRLALINLKIIIYEAQIDALESSLEDELNNTEAKKVLRILYDVRTELNELKMYRDQLTRKLKKGVDVR